jgi:DNA-binding CsgD family transcriptional regulator
MTKQLTLRETQVLNLIVNAKSRKIIADELNISINTLDKHIYHIHMKTNTHSIGELILWYLKSGKMASASLPLP